MSLPLIRNAELSVPPLIVTRASAPTFSVLISSVPSPLVVTLLSTCVPLRISSLAPASIAKVPVLVPPDCISIVPASTLTVPVLLNTVLMVVVVADCLLNVSLLLKVPPMMVLAKPLESVKVPLLLKVLVAARVMVLLLAAVFPDQVVVLPAFTMRPPASCLPLAPLMARVPSNWVVPVPDRMPVVQIEGPVTVSVPVPDIVPPP